VDASMRGGSPALCRRSSPTARGAKSSTRERRPSLSRRTPSAAAEP
jgi:hypothetical protein